MSFLENNNIYTDLALEERERFKENVEIEGVKINKKYDENMHMTTTVVDIFNEKGAGEMGKPEGCYVTMETKLLKDNDEDFRKKIAEELTDNLVTIMEKQRPESVLIVGLGNLYATPDALGNKTVEKIESGNGLYCVSPGLLSQT